MMPILFHTVVFLARLALIRYDRNRQRRTARTGHYRGKG